MESKPKKIISKVFRKSRNLFTDFILFLITFILLWILFTIKATRLGLGYNLFFFYTVVITVFQLFRLIAAIIFSPSLSHTSYSDKEAIQNYWPMVTIVIPCKNEEEAIAHTLEKSFEAHYPKEKLEVIIINDGSTDNTLREIEKVKEMHPELIVINWEKNRGKREGMAAGFRIAKGEIIVQLDSDSYIEPRSFRELILPFHNSKIAAVCGHADVANAGENIITKMQASYYFVAFRILKAAESIFGSVFCCSGCSSAYRKDVVIPILDEWMDEKFMGVQVKHGDDRSLTGWVLKLGYKTIYTHRAQAYTIAPSTIGQFVRQQIRWKKSWISNAYFTFFYIFKTDPLIGLFYFTPLVFISLLTPLVAFYNIYLLSVLRLSFPLYYLFGGFIITLLYVLYAWRFTKKKNHYLEYFFLWQLLTVLFLSYIIFYSFISFRNQKWGTR